MTALQEWGRVLAFVLAIAVITAGPLIAPHPRPRRTTPAWAQGRLQARRTAQHTRTDGRTR